MVTLFWCPPWGNLVAGMSSDLAVDWQGCIDFSCDVFLSLFCCVMYLLTYFTSVAIKEAWSKLSTNVVFWEVIDLLFVSLFPPFCWNRVARLRSHLNVTCCAGYKIAPTRLHPNLSPNLSPTSSSSCLWWWFLNEFEENGASAMVTDFAEDLMSIDTLPLLPILLGFWSIDTLNREGI